MEGSNNNNNEQPIAVDANLQESYLRLWSKFKLFVETNITLIPEHATKVSLIFNRDPMLILMVMVNTIANGKDAEFRAVVDKRDFELMKLFGEKHGMMRRDFQCDKEVIEKAFDFAELFLLTLDAIVKGK